MEALWSISTFKLKECEDIVMTSTEIELRVSSEPIRRQYSCFPKEEILRAWLFPNSASATYESLKVTFKWDENNVPPFVLSYT